MASEPGPADPGDEYYNNIIATGALLALLGSSESPTLAAVSLITDVDGNATNEVAVQFTFLKSTYRVVIERIPD